jgi:hypothetical protein
MRPLYEAPFAEPSGLIAAAHTAMLAPVAATVGMLGTGSRVGRIHAR